MGSQETHLDFFSIKDILSKVFSYVPLKIGVGLFTTIISFLFEGKIEVLCSIFSLIAIDTITGVWVAVKAKEVSSRGFYRVALKCLMYFLMIIVGRLVDKHLPIAFASGMMEAFLAVTEGISILENIHKLGFPVPTNLVEKLKSFREEKKETQ